jgi:hypothetical protein
MIKVYLVTNAGLYFALALLCTLKHRQTSRGTGFTELNNSGHSEYLVIYGGLQMGLALFFAWLARDAQLARVGIVFSVMLYAPIVLYRVITVLMYKPVSSVTLGTAALEVALLIWGALLLRSV